MLTFSETLDGLIVLETWMVSESYNDREHALIVEPDGSLNVMYQMSAGGYWWQCSAVTRADAPPHHHLQEMIDSSDILETWQESETDLAHRLRVKEDGDLIMEWQSHNNTLDWYVCKVIDHGPESCS